MGEAAAACFKNIPTTACQSSSAEINLFVLKK
jgi:hypothetical protein